MALKQLLVLATSLLIVPLLSGCFGGGAEVESHVSTVSQGTELNDLKRAHELGAINDDEYESLRKAMLRKDR